MARYERALVMHEKALGPDHPLVATSLDNIALIHETRGAHGEAKTLYARSLIIREKALDLDHPHVADPLLGLARVALEQRRADEAVPLAERAVDVRERGGVGKTLVAEGRFVLARALWSASGDRARAHVLAEQARDAYRDGGEADALAEVEAWLAKHDAGR